jgi:hypothetical protein
VSPSEALSSAEIQLLWQLQSELPRLRATIASARVISSYPRAAESRHPILAFAFNRVPAAVIESQLLRLAEAIDLLDKAAIQYTASALKRKDGRRDTVHDPDLDLLLRLRDYRIAHLIKLRSLADQAYDEMTARYRTAFDFLEVVLAKVEEVLGELEDAGLFDHREGLVSSYSVEEPFTAEDLDRLVRVANDLLRDEQPGT